MRKPSEGKRRRFQRIFLISSCSYLLILVIAATAAPLITGPGPTEQNLNERLRPPLSRGHLFGTDELGRDVWSRLVYGSRSLLVVGTVSVGIAAGVGFILGLISGLAGGIIDGFIMLLMDGVLSFPTVLLAITVVSLFGYGLPQVMLATGIVFSPVFARIVRAETMSLMTEGFVESSRALGSPLPKIVLRHILPNMAPALIVQSTITFALAVVIEASLSFLGLGTQPPNPSWGLMLKDARGYMFQAPWLALWPGLALAATVFSSNYLGDYLSDRLNPKG